MKSSFKKIICNLIPYVLVVILLLGINYYYQGSYLIGSKCFAITKSPSDKLISSYNKVEHLVIDEDGGTMLVSPCKNGMNVRISTFIINSDGSTQEQYILFENKSMNKNEAVAVKIKSDNSQLIYLIGAKVNKIFSMPINDGSFKDKNTVYFTFFY